MFLFTSALSKAELRIYQDLATSPVSQDDLFREPVSLDTTTIYIVVCLKRKWIYVRLMASFQ